MPTIEAAVRPWHDHLPPGSPFRPEDLTARGSLPAAWAACWERVPQARVLYDATGANAESARRWYVGSEIEELTRRAAHGLLALGLRRGDHVLWSAETSMDAVLVALGALRAGLVVVPVNPAYSARELAHIIGEVRPEVAVAGGSRTATAMAGAAANISPAVPMDVLTPSLDHAAGSGTARDSRVGTSAPAAARGDGCDLGGALDTVAPSDPALVCFTSGTTGAPKGAVLTHANVLAACESVALAWRWSAEDCLVHALPLFHVHGLIGLFGTLLTGASAVLLGRFDVDRLLDASEEHRATMFFGVPTMYHRLAASSRVTELARLRLAVSGSAPLPAELHLELAESAGTVVLERYGMSETMLTVSNPYEGDRRAGTVGFPLPGVELLFDREAAAAPKRTAEGGNGELLVRGPTVFSGYLHRPSETAERFADGWFRTGDVGVVEEGYVRLLGRTSELIISGGFNVYPTEVEDVLHGHPGIVEVAVTGTPSDEWGEVVTAWIVAEPGTRGHEVLAYAAERLAPYKRPKIVRFVERLPRNAMGKIQRVELR